MFERHNNMVLVIVLKKSTLGADINMLLFLRKQPIGGPYIVVIDTVSVTSAPVRHKYYSFV